MFEKFHSYAFLRILQSEMQDLPEAERRFLMPITIHEKQWLQGALETNPTSLFLAEKTIRKLKSMLKEEIPNHGEGEFVIEKGKPFLSKRDNSLSFWTHLIMQRQAVTCRIAYGDEKREVTILPIKLEYSLKLAEWKLNGLEIDSGRTSLVYLRLDQISEVQVCPIGKEQYETYSTAFYKKLEDSLEKAVIRLNREVFSDHPIEDEKLRILYALSSFDKEVSIDENDDRFYEITIYYYPQDYSNLLSVIQLLGIRIEVLAPASLRQSIKEIAQKAFTRYHV